MPKKLFILTLILNMTSSLTCFARGEVEEPLPPYNPEQEGWQALQIKEGPTSLKPVNKKAFQLIYKDATKANPNALNLYLKDFFGQALANYALNGADFYLQLKPKQEISITSSSKPTSFVRTSLGHQEWYNSDLIVGFNLSAEERLFPQLPVTANKRYLLSGYITLPLNTLLVNPSQPETGLRYALAKLAAEVLSERSSLRGRVWLLEHRLFPSRSGQIGLYIKIIADIH